MPDFRGPKPNPIVIAASKMITPIWLKNREQLTIDIHGKPEDIEAFKRSTRAVILLNHPDRQDPFVVVELARKMNENFYCIAARECFDWDNGLRGWLFQRIGCYSVARGKADFHSIATTEKILKEGKHKLVVFPEAEITADEEHVHEMHKAIFHIVLKVYAEGGKGARHPLVIIPAASKFALEGKLADAVRPTLVKIAEGLKITARESDDSVADIKFVVDAYLNRVYQVYGLKRLDAPLDKTAEDVAVLILEKIATAMKRELDRSESSTEMLYDLRNKTAGGAPMHSVAIEPDVFYCAGIAKPSIQSDFERVERLLIAHRMLQHTNSEVQCCRILDFIESEMFGKISPKGFQKCSVELGAPIDVASYADQFATAKDEAVTALSEYFRKKLQSMLQ